MDLDRVPAWKGRQIRRLRALRGDDEIEEESGLPERKQAVLVRTHNEQLSVERVSAAVGDRATIRAFRHAAGWNARGSIR